MKIILEPRESESIFHDALCNGLGCLGQYGIDLDYNEDEYKSSRSKIGPNAPCFEEVLMQMLHDGYSLTFTDTENGEDEVNVTLNDIHEKVQLTESRHLLDIINETGDSGTADAVLQTVLYGEVIFG
jgi:hypothetical protein